MSYASGTTHYNLPQTVGTDKRDWTDTNQAFSDVDTALYGAVQSAETATSGITTLNAAVETINGKLATDEGNISTLSGKVSTLESTVGTQGTAIADVRQDLQDNIESNHEASATSTHLYNVGDTFYYNDVLYRATAQIAIGGTIVPSTNCTAVTVMSELNPVIAQKSTKIAEVTADGVKTYAVLGSELYQAVGTFSTDYDYIFVTIPSNGTATYAHVNAIVPTSVGFSRCDIGTNSARINGYQFASNSSEVTFLTATMSTSGTTIADNASSVATSGVKLAIYARKL